MQSKNKVDTVKKKVKAPGKSSQIKIAKKSKTIISKPVPEQATTKKILKESSKEEKRRSEFESQIKKVNDLIAEGYIRQAYSAIPKEEKFSEKSDTIKSLKSELMEKIWNL